VAVTFSDLPYPPSLAGAWTLATADLHFTGFARIDLVDAEVQVRAARGLMAHLRYTLSFKPQLRSFAGAALPPDQMVEFTAGDGPAGLPPPPPPHTVDEALAALARAGCAARGCHSSAAHLRELDLETAAGLSNARSRRSLERPDVALIAPGSHADSFLLWKGLSHALGHRSADAASASIAHDDARLLADWIDGGAPSQ
jgi:hypothetical protein